MDQAGASIQGRHVPTKATLAGDQLCHGSCPDASTEPATDLHDHAASLTTLSGLRLAGGVWVDPPSGSSGGELLAGITPAELAAIRGRLEAFADDLFESLPRKDQRARGACYLRGLMLDGRRKSIEPMAQRLGEVHYQALHHFVAVSPWDWRPVRRRLAERLVDELEPTVWAVDDTGFPKDGEHSVGVQRQSCGTCRGGRPATCPSRCGTDPSGSWCWTCWTS